MKQVTRKILVIDDNPDNLISLKAQITDLFNGFTVYTATSGAAGIELAGQHQIDVILLDILMPGMDGFAVCKSLKTNDLLREIPVVFVTALKENRVNKVRALEVGADGFITKPVDEQELVAQLTTMLKVKDANDFKKSEMLRLEQMVVERTRQLQKLSQAVEQSPASVVITSPSGEIEYVNSKFTEVTGYTPYEVVGRNPRILKSGKQSKDFYRELWDTISSGREWVGEFHNKKKNGELYWETARISPIKNEAGIIINYLAAKEDITELKQAEKNYRLSIDQSPIGIRIVNQAGKTVYANRAYLAIYDYSSLMEYVSTPAKQRYTDESYREHEERRKIRKQGGEANEYEVSIRQKNGGIRYIKVWWKEVLWNREKHFQVINQDITREKLLYIDLVEAKNKAEESDRLKSAFLANMSHEIRTPMNGILGFAELLKEPDLTGDQQRLYIDLINKSGQRMLNIIKDIIDISKIEAGSMEMLLSDTNIRDQFEFIDNFFKAEATAKGLDFKVNQVREGQNIVLRTDREKLYAVLTNLVKNAIKFTAQGSVEVGCVQKGSTVEFYVKDTGIGIAADRRQAVFERFVQADIEDKMAYQGAGLGLTISKKYVEMLGGSIWLESEVGVGTTFYFTLPSAASEEPAPLKASSATNQPVAENRLLKILVVEDDAVSAMLIKKVISSLSKELLFSTDGVDAVQKCRDNSDIDLILMDIRMPVMGGYEATQLIREFNKEVVIIAQTAFGLSGDREKAMEAGCNDYISKPINIEELKTKISSLFRL